MEPDVLTEALRRPDAWPGGPREVECIETHISRVYLVGDRAYKVKKELVLPFLDYGTLEKRRAFCEAEIVLNRRLAPGVYLRVAPIARDAAGRVALDGPGEVVEYAVEMARLPQQGMLDALLERGEVDNELVRDVAGLLADFHAGAATGPGVDEHARFDAVARNARDNLGVVSEHAGRGTDVLTARLQRFLRESRERDLAELRELIERRAARGRAREGHGDLHAGNLCRVDGRIVAYDCIEFSAALRCGDVACDLAFLAMDLDARGFRGFSSVLVKAYAERASDGDLECVAPFYKAYRASVRGSVAALRAAGLEGERREAARAEARRYLHLCASYSLPPLLVLTCGLPASGKSWVAAHVARPFEAVSLSSDVRRKQLAGVPLDEHRGDEIDSGLYAPEMSARTYASLLTSAREALLRGRTVVVDATFARAARRAPFRELARERGSPFVVAHVRADEATIRRRFEERAREGGLASDATWEVYRHAKRSFEPPDELDAAERVDLASGRVTGEEAAAEVIERALLQLERGAEG